METPRRRIDVAPFHSTPPCPINLTTGRPESGQTGPTEEGRGQRWKWTLDRAETESGVAWLTLSVTSLHCISIHPNPDYNI